MTDKLSNRSMAIRKIKDLEDPHEEIVLAERKYNYQPQLTTKLDHHSNDFTQITMLEIVLWKTNRYPVVTQELLTMINSLRDSYSDAKAKDLLRLLLSKDMKGFDLPMASTVLRFAVPDRLQIIDQRVYRFITDNDRLAIPANIEKKVDLYFNYIEKLKTVCEEYQIPFYKADRILYQLDKFHNTKVKLRKY